MKTKKFFFLALTGVLTLGLLTYTFVDLLVEPRNLREPASISNNYESLKGCEKQNVLWDRVQATAYKELPDYQKFGLFELMAMSKQILGTKGSLHSDFAPPEWKKYLHRRGSIAKVKVVPVTGSPYTGIFKGAECALLRLSLTYKTFESEPVAPGLAFKVLRDGVSSANISALVSLDGQARDFNFFKNPMSNIVPMGKKNGQKMVHYLFSQTSRYPEELVVEDMASIDAHGAVSLKAVSPRQLFFVPGDNFKESLKFSSDEHDVRRDFMTIPKGTVVYKIHAVVDRFKSFDYVTMYNAKDVESFNAQSEHIADIVTTSEFVASEFGDDGIFFRHQIRPK